MAVHAPKTPSMLAILDKLTISLYGRAWSESIATDICVSCGGEATVFTDDLSPEEYRITGLCQQCQNKTYRWRNDGRMDQC